MHDVERLAAQVAAHLEPAQRVLFVTGAGISVESGLPTYRGVGGLYEEDDTESGMPVEVALSGPIFSADPSISWRHIARLERAVRGATHNHAHELIAAFEADFVAVVVLTQNVDGFHKAAGSTAVIDIHGDCHDMLCQGCGDRFRVEDYARFTIPPRCDRCDHILRPDVVLFGEYLPTAKVTQLQRELARGFDVVFSIGTTNVFPYIAEPVLMAARLGRPTIEINPGTTEVSHAVAYRFETGATRALEAIHAAWRARR